MTLVDEAKASELDAITDQRSFSAKVGEEVFAIVDVLDATPSLRRALTDPSQSPQARMALAERVFGTKVSLDATWILAQTVLLRWRNGASLADALERQAARVLLSDAAEQGVLDNVRESLSKFVSAVEQHKGLREALRDPAFALAHRQELVTKLSEAKVHPIGALLLKRAVGARQRSFVLTTRWYLQLAANLRSRTLAYVTAARELTDEQMSRLRAGLAAQAGRDVDVVVSIDPDVLGGIRVRFGDDRIESTVAARLEDAQRLITS